MPASSHAHRSRFRERTQRVSMRLRSGAQEMIVDNGLGLAYRESCCGCWWKAVVAWGEKHSWLGARSGYTPHPRSRGVGERRALNRLSLSLKLCASLVWLHAFAYLPPPPAPLPAEARQMSLRLDSRCLRMPDTPILPTPARTSYPPTCYSPSGSPHLASPTPSSRDPDLEPTELYSLYHERLPLPAVSLTLSQP